MNKDDDISVADDKLRGAAAIAAELGEERWWVYAHANELEGVYREGRIIIGSRRVLRARRRRLASAAE